MAVEIRPLQGRFGASVFGAPPTLEMDDATFRQIEAAWYDHSILIFHGLKMSPAQHIAFTKRLGALHFMEPPNITLPDHPEVFVVSNATQDGKPVGLKRAGEGFHSDGEDKIIPNAGSFLYAITVPPERGDTLFVDMYSAYEALPAEFKRKLTGKRARFSRIDMHHIHYPLMAPLTDEQKRKRPDVFHPIFRKHPKSGRTALYLGRWACDIEGMAPAEGRALIKELQAFAQQPRFILRQRWTVGDAVLWDNRCTQHCATGFDDEKYVRTMYRTTLEGEAPIMAEPDRLNAA
jgi:taurine dioxygenase